MKNKYFNFNIKNSIIGLFTGFVNGIFGSGGGTLLVPILNNIVKIEEHKSHATALAIIVFLTSASSVILGAKLLSKVTGKFLRITFGTIMIIAAIRMVF